MYRFENVFESELPARIRRRTSLRTLRALAQRVWDKYGRKGLSAPVIEFGDGIKHGDTMYSYAMGFKYIELSEKQRTPAVLLHELTHTLGYGAFPNGHGIGFARKYQDLLVEFGGCDRDNLIIGMAMFGIRT